MLISSFFSLLSPPSVIQKGWRKDREMEGRKEGNMERRKKGRREGGGEGRGREREGEKEKSLQ